MRFSLDVKAGVAQLRSMANHGVKDSILSVQSDRDIRDRRVKHNGCTPTTAGESARKSRQKMRRLYEGRRYPTGWTSFDDNHLLLPNGAENDAGASSFAPAPV
ncbi:hypothetical protein BDV96DRAFT_272063 [Lophiotrema nucula]|uniref:Uncharacterized protein n=1 Tax=Lophiotrema nucula TaxID=690887 RepID=A0A6A5ZNA8_9PLEO|nr:hypothetical protein BDV96DRAFT_272063 [Lophiotrema nucula]